MIAIDGPAASGKSTLAQRLAEDLGYLYFDTGVMYRAVTLEALRKGVSIEDELKVTEIAETISIDVRPPSIEDGRMFDVWVEGEDVTWDIRSADVDQWVSKVSMYSRVRKAMTMRQREIGLRGHVVMVGRDIGTVVLPEADLKIYLDAHVNERARRRFLESKPGPEFESYEEVLESMDKRDHLDSTRDLAPLKASPDAIVIDTTDLDIEQVFQFVKGLMVRRSSDRSAEDRK
jgi:cytidylate kinase